MTDDDSRTQGIEFGDLDEELDRLEYPVGADSLVEELGDREVELADDTPSLREVLSGYQDREFESSDDVRQAVKNMVGSAAVGRERYSDRGTGADVDETVEDDSF